MDNVIAFPNGKTNSVDLDQEIEQEPNKETEQESVSDEELTPTQRDLKKYKKRGFRLVYYPSKTKAPNTADWQKEDRSAESYKEGQNVGVMCGSPLLTGGFLADVDFDWKPGTDLTTGILPITGFFFGHSPSKPLSHAFYSTPKPAGYFKYNNIAYDEDCFRGVETKQCFVELRGANERDKYTAQTMIPPSLWCNEDPKKPRKPNEPYKEEPLKFYRTSSIDSEIVSCEDLPRRVLVYAVACLLHANIEHGSIGHDMRLAMVGFLLTNGFSSEETYSIAKNLIELDGPHTKELDTVMESTLRAMKGKRPVAGRTKLVDLLGRYGSRVVNQITQWIGGSPFIEVKGQIKSCQENVRRAFEICDIKFSYNRFSGKTMVSYPEDLLATNDDTNAASSLIELDDAIVTSVWLAIDRRYGFLPEISFYEHIITAVAHEHEFHPIIDYLKSLIWDGVPRIDTWVVQCAGAEDSPYVRAVSSILLKAAVKRLTHPGCKYDELVVFESGTQGLMKSTALRVLCKNEDWFSDDVPMSAKSKELMENTAGKWIMEIAELNKMRSTQMEQIKAMLSRQEDTSRLAWGRIPKTQPRQFVMIGTTNSYVYLSDQTGNRRFWPIRVKKFNIKWLLENRDQLWAEAYSREQKGESIRLPEELYKAAEEQQSQRLLDDSWEDLLNIYFENQYQRVAYDELWEVLGIPNDRVNKDLIQRVAAILQSLGFEHSQVRNRKGQSAKGWSRNDKFTNEEWQKRRGEISEEDKMKTKKSKSLLD